MVLNIQSSFYGQSDAPMMWYEKLNTGVETMGFNNDGVDLCKLISEKLICVSYVDYCIFFVRY